MHAAYCMHVWGKPIEIYTIIIATVWWQKGVLGGLEPAHAALKFEGQRHKAPPKHASSKITVTIPKYHYKYYIPLGTQKKSTC